MEAYLEWQTLTHKHTDKGADWFWAVGIITIAIALSAVLLNNILFAVFVIVAALALIIQTLKKPDVITVRITDRGIEIGKALYLYSSIDAFWIDDETDDRHLILKSNKLFMPFISVHIVEGIDTNDLYEYLSEFLEEEEMHTALSQKIMEYLGF